MKKRTNRDALKLLIQKLDDVQLALLRERILTICEHTAQESQHWEENTFISPKLYEQLNSDVKKYIGFEN